MGGMVRTEAITYRGLRSWAVQIGLTLVVACFLLPTPGAAGSAAAVSEAAQRGDTPNLAFVWAVSGGGRDLGRPAGAAVRIRWHGRVIGRGKTGHRGIAIVRLKRVPRHFSVEVGGGTLRGGHRQQRLKGLLRARIANYRGGPIHVNPATTLAFFYKRLHPRLAERAARNRVARFLRLPAKHDFDTDIHSSAFFNGRRYVRRAGRAGGLGRFSHRIARTIDRRRARGRASALVASASVSEASLGTLATLSRELSSYRGIFSAIGGISGTLGIVNTVMSLAGADPIGAEIDQLGREMNELLLEVQAVKQQIEKLESVVTSFNAESTFAILEGQSQGLIAKIELARKKWEGITNLGAEISCPNGAGNCPDPIDVKEVCAANPNRADCAVLQSLIYGTNGFVEYMANNGLNGPVP